MSALELLLLAVVLIAAYALFAAVLLLAGRRTDARAWAGFIPDCLVLARWLLSDPRVGRRSRFLLAALVVYLAFPIDVVPDFLPVVGHLDDAVAVALVLRAVLRGAGAEVISEHWPGPQRSLAAVLRLAGKPA